MPNSFVVAAILGLLILGPLAAIPIGVQNVNLYLADIFAGCLSVYWIANFQTLRTYFHENIIVRLFGLFGTVALMSFLLTTVDLTIWQRTVSFLYLVRFISYFSFYLFAIHWSHIKGFSQNLEKKMIGAIVIVAIIGWVQYFLYPDLRNLFYLGWDPHFFRVFSTYFDPNFLGLLLVFALILLFFQKKKSIPIIVSSIIILATLLFTYSRSSYLSFIVAFLYLSVSLKKYLYFGVVILLLIGAVFLLPRSHGEGGKLERVFSIYQRVDNWKLGLSMFGGHPLLGVGYDTIRYAKSSYIHDPLDNYQSNHSGAGLDNSMLFVAVTTGIIGLTIYLFLWGKLFLQNSLVIRVTILAAFVHGMFQNSLFFPWIMMWLWLVAGISRKK